MQWEIINTPKQPKCIYCFKTTEQMLVCHRPIGVGNVNICSSCARYVKDAMNKWEGLKSTNYIEQVGSIFDSKFIDETIEQHRVDPDDEMKSMNDDVCTRIDLHRCDKPHIARTD